MADNFTTINNSPSTVQGYLKADGDVFQNSEFRRIWQPILTNSTHIQAVEGSAVDFEKWQAGWLYYFNADSDNDKLYLALKTYSELGEYDKNEFLNKFVVIFVANGVSVDKSNNAIKVPLNDNKTYSFYLQEDDNTIIVGFE